MGVLVVEKDYVYALVNYLIFDNGFILSADYFLRKIIVAVIMKGRI